MTPGFSSVEKPVMNGIMECFGTMATEQLIGGQVDNETNTHKFERMMPAPRAAPEPGCELMDRPAAALRRPLQQR